MIELQMKRLWLFWLLLSLLNWNTSNANETNEENDVKDFETQSETMEIATSKLPVTDLPKPLRLSWQQDEEAKDIETTKFENSNRRQRSRRLTLIDVALQQSVREGLDAMTELYGRIQPDMLRNGQLLQDNHPAALLSRFNEPNIEDTEHREMAAYATLSATKAFHKNYKHINELARQSHANKISLRRTALEGLCPPRDPPTCMPASERYRTHDGTCNNKRRPRWGAAQMPFNRFLPPEYGDGVDSVRTATDGNPLSSARFVSLLVHGAREGDAPLTLMIAQWGQLLDHDMTSTAQPRSINGSIPSCCGGKDFHPSCFPIKVPLDDPWLSPLKVRCLEFLRSAPAQRRDCVLTWREQTNQATAYIDASPIYSNNAKSSDNGRIFRSGQLVYGRGKTADDVCQRGAISTQCIRAGDGRSGEQPGLLALHHVWSGEHNRIAQELSELNQHWSDEKLYQETRRIVGAMFQHITYREFLPIVLGREVCKLFDLELLSTGYYEGYDPKANPTVSNAFAAAAFRFGHSLVQNSYIRCDRHHNVINNNVSLHEEFQRGDIGSAGSLHRLLRGLATQRALKRDEFITPELTNHLFQTPGFPFGLDLAAINIQRGRDHGIAPYTAWRVPCGLSAIHNWDDFANVVGPESAKRIGHAYRSVHDIDLFVGGIAERPVVGGIVGPTFACIIAQQFSNSRKGDRFWYENGGFESSFTPAQLQSLRRVNLAQVMCRTVGGGTFQPHIFIPPEFPENERINCNFGDLAPIDLRPWLEQDPFAAPRPNTDAHNPGGGALNFAPIVKEEKLGFPIRGNPTPIPRPNVDFKPNSSVGFKRPQNSSKISDKLDIKRKQTTASNNRITTRKPVKGVNNKLDKSPQITLNIKNVNIRRPIQSTTRRTVIINNIPIELRHAPVEDTKETDTTKTITTELTKHKKNTNVLEGRTEDASKSTDVKTEELTEDASGTTEVMSREEPIEDNSESTKKEIEKSETQETSKESTGQNVESQETEDHSDNTELKTTTDDNSETTESGSEEFINKNIDTKQQSKDNVEVKTTETVEEDNNRTEETKTTDDETIDKVLTKLKLITQAKSEKAKTDSRIFNSDLLDSNNTDDIDPLKQETEQPELKRVQRTVRDSKILKITTIDDKPLLNFNKTAFSKFTDTKLFFHLKKNHTTETTTTTPSGRIQTTTPTTVTRLQAKTTKQGIELRSQYQNGRPIYNRPQKVILNGPDAEQYEIEINIRQTNKSPVATRPLADYTTVYKPYGPYESSYAPYYVADYATTTIAPPAYAYYQPQSTAAQTQNQRTKPPTIIYLNEPDDHPKTTARPNVFQNFLTFATNSLTNNRRPTSPSPTPLSVADIQIPHSGGPNSFVARPALSAHSDSNQLHHSVSSSPWSQAHYPVSSIQTQYPVSMNTQIGVNPSSGFLHASSSAVTSGNFGSISGIASANGADNIFSFNIRPGRPDTSQVVANYAGSYGFLPSRKTTNTPPDYINLPLSTPQSELYYDRKTNQATGPFSSGQLRPQTNNNYYARTPESKEAGVTNDIQNTPDHKLDLNDFDFLSRGNIAKNNLTSTEDDESKETDVNDNDEDYHYDGSNEDEDENNDDIESIVAPTKKFDRDGYLRPELMLSSLGKSETLAMTSNDAKTNETYLDDNYVLPMLTNNSRSYLTGPPKPLVRINAYDNIEDVTTTDFPDTLGKQLSNEIEAEEEVAHELPNHIRFNPMKHRPMMSAVAFAPIKVLTEPDRPDNWLIYEMPSEKPPLPQQPVVSIDSEHTAEVPKPLKDTNGLWLKDQIKHINAEVVDTETETSDDTTTTLDSVTEDVATTTTSAALLETTTTTTIIENTTEREVTTTKPN